MKEVSRLTAVILSGLLAAATPVFAKEDPLAKAPKPVQQAVKAYADQSFGGGVSYRLLVIQREKETIYTVDLFGHDGKKKSLSLTPPGKILEDVIRPAEKIIPWKEAPFGVRISQIRQDLPMAELIQRMCRCFLNDTLKRLLWWT